MRGGSGAGGKDVGGRRLKKEIAQRQLQRRTRAWKGSSKENRTRKKRPKKKRVGVSAGLTTPGQVSQSPPETRNTRGNGETNPGSILKKKTGKPMRTRSGRRAARGVEGLREGGWRTVDKMGLRGAGQKRRGTQNGGQKGGRGGGGSVGKPGVGTKGKKNKNCRRGP